MTELLTSRLILRPARPEDAPCYALAMGEFAVARWLTPMPWPFTLAMATDWLRQAPEPGPEKALFIIELPGKGLIGCMANNGELGFWIARPHWGRGYAREAVTAFLDWHFAHSGNDAIKSSAQGDNAASLGLKSRLGFQETGRERRYSQALQYNVEHVLTRLTRADWLGREDRQCA
jgi:RimJ/RimL family protein N-acetyltransferase